MDIKSKMTGLTDSEVVKSRAEHGENVITPPKRESVWKLFFEKFEDPIIRVLILAAFLSLIISIIHNEYAETVGIFFAIFLATGVGFWFEYDAGRKFDLLNQTSDDVNVKVIRNGNITEIPRREVVVGDIVVLESGEEIPADGVLIESMMMSVNESCLTGEPIISKTTNPEHFKKDSTYPSNHVMKGTTVVEGHGTMQVSSVGDNSEFGKVAMQSTIDSHEKTPLNIQLEKLAKIIGVVGFGLALLTFWALFAKDLVKTGFVFTLPTIWTFVVALVTVTVLGVKIWMPIVCDAAHMFKLNFNQPKVIENRGWAFWIAVGVLVAAVLYAIGYFALGVNPLSLESWISLAMAENILQNFMVAVTLIVVAVPEGLPMSVTLSLALSMRRMLKTNNLVRKMHACETMGAATVICTDKTGTLTQNQMRVSETAFFSLKDQHLGDNRLSNLIKEGIATNSTAHLDITDPSKVKAIGNPTEGALLLWLRSQEVDYAKLRSSVEIIDQMPFTTERKYMATLAASGLLGKRVIYVKGAPEIVLGKCRKVLMDGEEKDSANYKGEIEARLTGYQNQAMRTLGFAYTFIDESVMSLEAALATDPEFIFLGVAAIADPVREDVPQAVSACLEAGIMVKIVTGDTPNTAKEIARQIGLWTPEDTDINHITGAEFAELSDEVLLERVNGLKIMSRARPMDKQRLVQLLQRKGHVVAVTGDGTNDAPALNFAQVGLSMGTGTSVAKEASDITLLDDSFNSIVTAVLWGRSLYRNIQKFVVFQLTINVVALVIVLLGSILGTEIPLTVTQMLWVNLIMDTFAAGALASLPPDPTVMKDKPRSVNQFIITKPMMWRILGVGIIFIMLMLAMMNYMSNMPQGLDPKNLTIFFTVFVMLQFWNLFNAKALGADNSAFKQWYKCGGFLGVLVLILIGQILIVTFGGDVFRTIPLSVTDWLWIIVLTSPVLWVGEIIRAVKRLIKK